MWQYHSLFPVDPGKKQGSPNGTQAAGTKEIGPLPLSPGTFYFGLQEILVAVQTFGSL
jgi:hypothetical protein